MKISFLLLFFIPILSNAQNCSIKKVKDGFTQENKLTTGFISIGSDRLSIDANSKEIDFFFSLKSDKDSKCFDDASTVTILFEGDRLKSNFRSSGTMNCEGLFHFTLKNSNTTPTQLQNIINKKVKGFRFTNKKVITDITLTPEQTQMLADAASCMATEAKTLIKK
ncbi:MAG TPA: hypothetical protein VM888_14140 [Chitinophagaceae bacterium]|jgi:hypothetical protein|nr:hypothetical protein [Chitinophagaceae bacterium]